MEMRSNHKTLHNSCKDHVIMEEVCAKILQAIRPHEDLLTVVAKRCKLKCYGHVSSSSGLAKNILQGTVKGEVSWLAGILKKTRQTENEVGRQRQGMDGPEVHQLPEGSREQKNGGNWL